MKRRKQKQSSQFLGTYTLSSGQSAFGELRLKGANTLLKLHSDEYLMRIEPDSTIKGVSFTGEHLTLIDCFSPGTGSTSFKDKPTRYHAEIFPHYVVNGRSHLNPLEPCISAIHFTTNDLYTLFYDFDAFGSVIDAKPLIDAVLEEHRKVRPVEVGEHPQIQYFTGKDCIAEVASTIGKISINHRPEYGSGGPQGVSIKNRIIVTIAPSRPSTFSEAIQHMHDMATFLSMAAGRSQAISHIRITTTDDIDHHHPYLSIHPSHRWKAGDKSKQHSPHPGDVPFDPIRRPDEFASVLSNWIDRHPQWRSARFRYLGCMRKANHYDTDRLVAAANMFDILPSDATPPPNELPEELASAKKQCVAIFRQLPEGIERNSVLDSLGRLGQPSLPKKVAHRISIIESKLPSRFSDLQFVASMAIKCRNFFVHGNSDGFEYSKIDPFVPFLTDALEFIFAASDFIDAGWNAQLWIADAHGWGHTFSRFLSEYDAALAGLRKAVAP